MGVRVKGELNPHALIVLRSRMCKALPPFSRTSSHIHMEDISAVMLPDVCMKPACDHQNRVPCLGKPKSLHFWLAVTKIIS